MNLNAVSADGKFMTASVTLEPSTGIESVSTLPVASEIDVTLRSVSPASGATLRITPVTSQGTIIEQPVAGGEKSVSVDISGLPAGIYVITYIVDGNSVDSYKFTHN